MMGLSSTTPIWRDACKAADFLRRDSVNRLNPLDLGEGLIFRQLNLKLVLQIHPEHRLHAKKLS